MPEEALDIASAFENILTSFEGEAIEVQDWGRRKLAYKINGDDFGYYKLYYARINPDQVSEIIREVDLLPQDRAPLRYLVNQVDEEYVSYTAQFKGERDVPVSVKDLASKLSFKKSSDASSKPADYVQDEDSSRQEEAEIDEMVRGATKR